MGSMEALAEEENRIARIIVQHIRQESVTKAKQL